MSPEQRLWAFFGLLTMISMALIGSIAAPSDGTSPLLTLLALVVVVVGIYLNRQGRRRP